jgi:hypothetical protein
MSLVCSSYRSGSSLYDVLQGIACPAFEAHLVERAICKLDDGTCSCVHVNPYLTCCKHGLTRREWFRGSHANRGSEVVRVPCVCRTRNVRCSYIEHQRDLSGKCFLCMLVVPDNYPTTPSYAIAKEKSSEVVPDLGFHHNCLGDTNPSGVGET